MQLLNLTGSCKAGKKFNILSTHINFTVVVSVANTLLTWMLMQLAFIEPVYGDIVLLVVSFRMLIWVCKPKKGISAAKYYYNQSYNRNK